MENQRKAPSGLEWLVKSLISSLGIEPELIFRKVDEIRQIIIEFKSQQDRIESLLIELNQHMRNDGHEQDKLKKRPNGAGSIERQ